MWRDLIGPLAEHYRVICPDFRGLGWSDAPPSGYSLSRQTADLIGLLDELGLERVRVVGHDWGLVVSFWMCLHHPERLEQHIGMAGPHIWAASGTPPRAYMRPWHILLLASPLGQLAVRRFGLPEHALRTWRHLGSFTPDEMEIYLAPFRRPGAAKATAQRYWHLVGDLLWFLRHYRRLRVSVPTLHLVGENDPIIETRPNRYLQTHADDFIYETVPEAGHFFVEERPDWVRARLLEYFAADRAQSRGRSGERSGASPAAARS